jgi:alpha-galactosidase
MAAPLLIGTDLRKASAETLAILSNPDVIAVDQDKLGVQGQVIASGNGVSVFNKPLANGDRAVALYNSTDAPARVTTTSAQIGLKKSPAYRLSDLWTKAQTETAGAVAATVPAHGTVMYRVHPLTQWQQLPPATSLDVASGTAVNGADVSMPAGGTGTLSTSVRDYGREKLTDVRISGDAPDGWTLTPTTAWNAKTVKSNATFTTSWTVSAPAGLAPGRYPISFTATYGYGNRQIGQLRYRASVLVLPPAPSGTVQLSTIDWVSATNGWGPVEKDMSNGETGAGDGQPISIRGTKYAKGLGTNAESNVTYYLGGKCSTLTADVGIDDEEATKGGSVIFQVFADEKNVADSGVVTNTSPVKTLTADLTGATWLRLHVDPNGATTYDHGDWAAPTLTCS